MRKGIFFGILLGLMLLEAAMLLWLGLSGEDKPQDTVAVNEAVQTVQRDWGSLGEHVNHALLAYVVLDPDGTVLYRTRPGLSESLNAAVGHRDTILDIQVDGATVGKILIYNDAGKVFQSGRRAAIAVMAAAMLLQAAVCGGYYAYLYRTMIKPFRRMKRFAERVAEGNLDVPLEMDRQNLFGAFTESFDIMRSELKKARLAEARANADKKELVAKLSHDIKTPVASIQAASEVGEALSTDEKNRENYRRIIQKADQINVLVTNLFSATLEELRELKVAPSLMKSGELRALLENADYLHRCVTPPVPECLIFADRLRLQQVFDNIFANSYKYADTKIDITMSLRDGCLAVCVEDYGGGLDEAELPLVKEKFRRGGNTGNVEGAGLGLYISDYCMTRMGGGLDVENGRTGLRVTVRIALGDTI